MCDNRLLYKDAGVFILSPLATEPANAEPGWGGLGKGHIKDIHVELNGGRQCT